MNWLKRNWEWILVVTIVIIPLVKLYGMVYFNFEDNGYDLILFDDYEYPDEIAEELGTDVMPGIKYAIHTTGEWCIRLLIAALMCTPIRIVFGWNIKLFTRQAIGISTGIYALLHFALFVISENFISVFSEWELICGFLAALIVVLLMLTSNRRSMRILKAGWKKLHRFVYLAALLALLHVILLQEDWIIYAAILGFGFLVRLRVVRDRLSDLRTKKSLSQKLIPRKELKSDF